MNDDKQPQPPGGYVWGSIGMPRPESIPREMPGAWEGEQTLLYGPDGKTPILTRRRRSFGFQPSKESR